jgi:hypothetical protein
VQANKSHHSLKRKKGPGEQSGTIGQRLRGPTGRKPTPSRKADYFYPGKEIKGKVQSEANAKSESKVQSEPNNTATDMYDNNETMSERDMRRQWQGKTCTVPIKDKEREEMDEIIDWVNTTTPNVKMVQIDSLTISQKHLACLTNPYLDEKDKYLGDEVNVPKKFTRLFSINITKSY